MPDSESQPRSVRTYRVFSVIAASAVAEAIENGDLSPSTELLIPVGAYDADTPDDAIKAAAKANGADGADHAAVPERNFRRRTPKKKVTETWGFED